MGLTKRSPSPPEAGRSQVLPDWWVQQPNAGECVWPALPAIRHFVLWLGVLVTVRPYVLWKVTKSGLVKKSQP